MEQAQHNQAVNKFTILFVICVTAIVVGTVAWWFFNRADEVNEEASVLPENTWAISEHEDKGFNFEYPAWLFTEVQANENYGAFSYAPFYDGYGADDE